MLLNRLAGMLGCVVLVAAVAHAGTTGKIAGQVRDVSTREALIGVNILIEGTRMGAATNIEGYYVILNIPPGEYSLVASAVGYARQRIGSVRVSVDLTTTMDFDMKSTTVEGEEVVVTAERPLVRRDLTSSEARVDAKQIQNMPVREVSQVLGLQAGVTVGRGGEIHIRGGRSTEVAYWVDGISVSDAYDGSQTVQVDNNSVQELQVISGTFNAEYGQAMSGIVNIVTKEGAQRFSGNIITYSGDYVTSQGYKWNNRLYPVIAPDESFNPTPDDLYYGLNEIKPFATHNIEGSLSGPIPILPGVSFYMSGRYYRSSGWFYGSHIFNTDGSIVPELTSDRLVYDQTGTLTAVRLPDLPVEMNWRKRLSGQAKITIPFGGAIKLNLSALGSKIDYRDYSHAWFLLPDGDVSKHDRAYNFGGLWTHSLTATSFYTINFAYFFKGFKEYLYEDPYDPRYVVDPNATATDLYEFISAGTNNHRFNRTTETRVAKIDYTNQLSRLHLLQAGIEGKLHRLYLEDYSLTQDATTLLAAIPEPNSPLYEQYTRTPVELSAYVQDKLEYEKMIVNIGLRFDYFDPRAQFLSNPQDPNVYLPQIDSNKTRTLEERLTYWYKDAKPKYMVSPRFGISYPITDRGILHFSYGHFLQIPSFIHLYQRPDYKVTTASGVQGVYGNPDLDAQRSIMYEFGLQQQVSDMLSFDVTTFYRDVRNWVTTSPAIPVRDFNTYTSSYVTYVNRDYSNSRGVTLTVAKRQSDYWSMNLTYTFQMVEGSNSNPDEELAAQQNNSEPPRALTPLDWDQTHVANLSVGVGSGDWGVFALGRYASGYPYTPVINQAESRGEDAARAVQKNSRRQPDQLTVDLRLFKNFQIGFVNLSLSARVFNLFDARNEVTVYGQTGRAYATPQALGAGSVDKAGRVNPVEQYIIRPDYYSEPREIQLGVELNF